MCDPPTPVFVEFAECLHDDERLGERIDAAMGDRCVNRLACLGRTAADDYPKLKLARGDRLDFVESLAGLGRMKVDGRLCDDTSGKGGSDGTAMALARAAYKNQLSPQATACIAEECRRFDEHANT